MSGAALTAARAGSSVPSNEQNYTFVLIPKSVDNLFFVDVNTGFQASAKDLKNVQTVFLGPSFIDAEEQAALIYDVVNNPGKYNITQVDGMAVSVLDDKITGDAINFAINKNIPVITFDSDAPMSKRMAFISTNSSAFGEELGKVINQLDPRGGRYRMITGKGPNLDLRLDGIRRALKDTKWIEVYPPLDCLENNTLALEQMIAIATDPLIIRGIIPVGGWPMYEADAFKAFAKTYSCNRTFVVADTAPVQMDLMNQGYVDGLVGQLPFAIGKLSFEVLVNITKGKDLSGVYYGTHILEILRVPLQLPPVHINYNQIGNVAVLGYTLFSVVTFSSCALLSWICVHRKSRTVRASQPVFMALLCVGSLIMSSAMIPLSIGDENFSQKSTDIACMSIPWLLVIGFCTTFSALFTKTWRIVRILENAKRFRRIKITAKQVLYPYFSMLVANIIILTCWTTINPLVYKRQNTASKDGWNRVISSYGQCVSKIQDSTGGASPYLGCLAIINGGILILANVMAYRSRNIRTEFNESHYIAVVMASMLQAFLIGVPLIFLVLDQPLPYYVIVVVLDFAVCMATLMLMFIPKILAHRKYLKLKKAGNLSETASARDGLKILGQDENNQSVASSNRDTSVRSRPVQLYNRNPPERSRSLPVCNRALSSFSEKENCNEADERAVELPDISLCKDPIKSFRPFISSKSNGDLKSSLRSSKLFRSSSEMKLKKAGNLSDETSARDGLKILGRDESNQSVASSNRNTSVGSRPVQLYNRNPPERSLSLPELNRALSSFNEKEKSNEDDARAVELPENSLCKEPIKSFRPFISSKSNDEDLKSSLRSSTLTRSSREIIDQIMNTIEGLQESDKVKLIDSLLLKLQRLSIVSNKIPRPFEATLQEIEE